MTDNMTWAMIVLLIPLALVLVAIVLSLLFGLKSAKASGKAKGIVFPLLGVAIALPLGLSLIQCGSANARPDEPETALSQYARSNGMYRNTTDISNDCPVCPDQSMKKALFEIQNQAAKSEWWYGDVEVEGGYERYQRWRAYPDGYNDFFSKSITRSMVVDGNIIGSEACSKILAGQGFAAQTATQDCVYAEANSVDGGTMAFKMEDIQTKENLLI